MPIRQDADGRWHAEVCVNRRRLHRRLPEGATARDAKRVEAELTRALHTSTPKREVAIPGDPSLAQIMADYTERHAETLRSPETAKFHGYRIGRWLEGRRASEIREVVAAIREDMTGHYAPATINRSLGALKKALRMAWERKQTEVDYSGLIRRLPENNARSTTLTIEEVGKLAEHASPPVKAAIWISLFTGMRRGEILALKPADIAPDMITIQAGNTKTLRTRTVPVIPPVRPWLEYVPLTVNFEGLKSGFRRAREAAGMPHVTFHDLRRSCGTLLIRNGVRLDVVAKILGHSTTSVTERVYAHLSGDQVRKGLEVLTELHRKHG